MSLFRAFAYLRQCLFDHLQGRKVTVLAKCPKLDAFDEAYLKCKAISPCTLALSPRQD